MKKVYFRTDASMAIGYGHFIRTLALADMLKGHFDCTFYTVNPTFYQKEEMAKVCRFISLGADSHFPFFLSCLNGDEIVVLDNYFFSTDYQKSIKAKGCSLVCIDDMHDKHYVADIVINHGISTPEKFLVENHTQLCLGYDWALLRYPFLKNKERKRCSDLGLNIVICFGASDFYDLTGNFVSSLVSEERVNHITAIVGDKYNLGFGILSPKVEYLHNLSAEDIADVFRSSDLAFLSTSTICLEALACGVSVAGGYYVNNQLEVYNEYVSKGMIYPLGDLLTFEYTDSLLKDILYRQSGNNRLNSFAGIPHKYNLLFHNLFSLQDYQVDDFLFKDYRNLDKGEICEILKIRNDDSVRCWMDNYNIISIDDHLNFMGRLRFSCRKIYFGVFHDVDLVGSVNIEFDELMQTVERGIFISSQNLHKKVGSRIEKALEQILLQLNVSVITAKVLKENSRSLGFHLKNGYVLESSDDKFVYLVKRIV